MSTMQLRVNESMILIGRISKQESNQKLAFVCLIIFEFEEVMPITSRKEKKKIIRR
jgi:hypothetical protein